MCVYACMYVIIAILALSVLVCVLAFAATMGKVWVPAELRDQPTVRAGHCREPANCAMRLEGVTFARL